MKNIISLILFCIFFLNNIPVFANSCSKVKAITFANAVKKGDINSVSKYSESGFNPNQTYMGESMLLIALANKQHIMLDYLLNNGTDPNIKSITPPLLYSSFVKQDMYSFKRLLESGADLNRIYLKYPVQSYAMSKAIATKNNDILNMYIDNGANPNTPYTVPLLTYAVVKNNAYAVEKLIVAKADQTKTFMGITPEKLAINKGQSDIIRVFAKYDKDGNKKNISTTNLDKAINLLQETSLGPIFYECINGKNKTSKPINISYNDLSKFNKGNCFAITQLSKGKIFIFINEDLQYSSPEALATLIASMTVHQDGQDSINEEIYCATLMATLWAIFTENNEKLKIENSELVRTLNYYEQVFRENDYEISTFKPLIEFNPEYKNLRKSSRGFSNEEIGLINVDSFASTVKNNVQSYCIKHNVPDKLKKTCEVLAILGLIALTSAVIYSSAQVQYAQQVPYNYYNYNYNYNYYNFTYIYY